MTSLDCVRCGFMNLTTDTTCFKCGAALANLHQYFPPPSHNLDAIWRNKKVLVMTKQALLPDRCVKCNAPADTKLKRKLTWHHPAIYILAFIGLLLYLIVALVTRKTAIVDVGLCRDHVAARKRDILITWALGLSFVLSWVVSAMMEDMTFLLIGIALMFATAIYGVLRVRIVAPNKIDDHFVWLTGVHPSYLQQLPEWRGSVLGGLR
jgi:uncharacterized membrane protein